MYITGVFDSAELKDFLLKEFFEKQSVAIEKCHNSFATRMTAAVILSCLNSKQTQIRITTIRAQNKIAEMEISTQENFAAMRKKRIEQMAKMHHQISSPKLREMLKEVKLAKRNVDKPS